MQTFKLLQHDTVMLLQPVLVKQFGRAGAQLLSQLHYWLTKKDSLGCYHQGNRWIFNTAEEWSEQLHLSVRHVRRLFAQFVKLGIVKVEKLHKVKSNRTNYYSIDYERLNNSITKITDKMSSPSCQNGMMYNDAKTTIKDFNKSEKFEEFSELAGQGVQESGIEDQEPEQVKQVKNLKIKKDLESNVTVVSEFVALQIYPDKPLLASTQAITTAPTATHNTNHLAIKTSTVQDMLRVWNDNFKDQGKNKTVVKLSKELAPLLVAAFKTKFASNLANWQTYCEQIKSSPWLMSDSFNLTLIWALKFGTIDRIRAGDLGVQMSGIRNQESYDAKAAREEQIYQLIEALPESTVTKMLRHKIVEEIGAGYYFSWFHEAKFIRQNDHICMIAPNAFMQDWWETRYDRIMKLVAQELNSITLDRLKVKILEDNSHANHSKAEQGSDNEKLISNYNQICQLIEVKPESVLAKTLRHKIAKAIGSAAYHSWFHQAEFCEIDGKICIKAPNAFVEQYWQNHFDWVLPG